MIKCLQQYGIPFIDLRNFCICLSRFLGPMTKAIGRQIIDEGLEASDTAMRCKRIEEEDGKENQDDNQQCTRYGISLSLVIRDRLQ